MAKILKSDLNNSSISSMKTLLSNEISDAEKLISSLTSLIEDTSDELKGKGFDAIRQQVSLYISALNSRKKAAESLKDSISLGISTMNNFMESYDMLDDSELSTITTDINSISATINQIEYNYYNGVYKDEEGNNKVTLNSLIGNYRTQLNELNKLKEKLSQLNSTDSSAFSSVESAKDLVISYKTSVNEIQESNIV